jgi:putative PIN family toxin of toxin-antitoxin system
VIRAVVDTNILVSGLNRTGREGAVIDAWSEQEFQPCVSTALALEYQDVLARKFPVERRETAMKALQALLTRCEYVPIRYTYRPASPDPGDDFVVDCVLNSQALLVTANVRDFKGPGAELGFKVVGAETFLELMKQESAR